MNACYYNKRIEVPEGVEREALVKQLREGCRSDIDILKLASNLVIDGLLPLNRLHEVQVDSQLQLKMPSASDRRKRLFPPCDPRTGYVRYTSFVNEQVLIVVSLVFWA